jgi:hypothetical protein
MLRPATSPADARSLYLGHGDHKRVSCTEAALVVTNNQKQIYRYPVNRLSRVVSSPSVDWTGAALVLCMRQSIGIAWLDTQGSALGCLYPQHDREHEFKTALELMLETPDGLVLYQHWQRSRRMQVLTQWVRTTQTPIAPHDWETTKREWVYGMQLKTHLPIGLRGHCLAWVAAQLLEQAIPPVFWSAEGHSIDLDEHLCDLLWAEMNLCCGAITEAAQSCRELTHLFEHWQASNGSALLLHLESLRRTAMKMIYAP